MTRARGIGRDREGAGEGGEGWERLKFRILAKEKDNDVTINEGEGDYEWVSE